MAICLATSLNCADVTVAYADLERNVYAKAAIGVSGAYYIIVDRSPRSAFDDLTDRQLMIHEVAHLQAFELDNYTHNTEYRNICRALSAKFNEPCSRCDPV